MPFEVSNPELHVLHCRRCRQPIASLLRPVDLVRTTDDIRTLGVDGISVWCRRCGIATEYEFKDEPAAPAA